MKWLRLLIVLLPICPGYSQNGPYSKMEQENEVIFLLKTFQMEAVKAKISQTPDSYFKILVSGELNYLLEGTNNSLDSLGNNSTLEKRDSVLYHIFNGNYIRRKSNPDNSLAYENYVKAFNLAKTNQDSVLANYALIALNRLLINDDVPLEKDVYLKYVNTHRQYARDSIDTFWSNYFTLAFEMTYEDITEKNTAFLSLESRYKNLVKSAPNVDFFQGVALHMTGIFYTYPEDFKTARKYFFEAYETYNDQYYYSYHRKIITLIAFSIIDTREGKFDQAKHGLLKALKSKLVLGNPRFRKIIYQNLQKCYEAQRVSDSSLYYSKKVNEMTEVIDRIDYAERKREIDSKYQLAAKNEEISNLSTQKKSLKKSLNTLLPVLGISILILAILFMLYLKFKKKSSSLQEEKSETLQKLDELKQLVIKNHIVLRDKTKVYIADLVYIKAEDHYLKLFLSDGKNHLVRGKIKTIKEELPPNFLQCHRSFIVNSNYVKQTNNAKSLILINGEILPISRSFKGEF